MQIRLMEDAGSTSTPGVVDLSSYSREELVSATREGIAYALRLKKREEEMHAIAVGLARQLSATRATNAAMVLGLLLAPVPVVPPKVCDDATFESEVVVNEMEQMRASFRSREELDMRGRVSGGARP